MLRPATKRERFIEFPWRRFRWRLYGVLERLAYWVQPYGQFKPCVIYDANMHLTQIILEDTTIVWCPAFPGRAHEVDLGYDGQTGNLVGMQIWYDARNRAQHWTSKPVEHRK